MPSRCCETSTDTSPCSTVPARNGNNTFNLEIYLTDGYLSVDGILSSTRSYGDETITLARRKFDDGFNTGKPMEETIFFDTDPSWELEIADFVDNIKHDTPVEPGSTDDALKVMEAVYGIYEDGRIKKEQEVH